MLEDVNYINNHNYYNRPKQNQGWNQHRPNYSGNYQGINSYNNNNNFLPLRELVSNQEKLMDNFSTAIKNQISFNKMIESQLNQIAAVVPATNPGIPSQPEGLESTNLVDMFDAGNFWSNPVVEVIIDLLPVKRGDLGCPVIPISIGMVDFAEALCDFGSSVNIMSRVLYEKNLYTSFMRNNHVFAPCRSYAKFPKGNIEEPLRSSWYLIRPSRLHGHRDWY